MTRPNAWESEVIQTSPGLEPEVKPHSSNLPGTPWELKLLSVQPDTAFSLQNNLILAELRGPWWPGWSSLTASPVLCAPQQWTTAVTVQVTNLSLDFQRSIIWAFSLAYKSLPSLSAITSRDSSFVLTHPKYHFFITTPAALTPFSGYLHETGFIIKTLEAQPIKQLCSPPQV